MGAIGEAVGSPEFVAGLRWGGLVGLFALLVGLVWRWLRHEPAPIAGLATTVAVAVAVRITRPLPITVVVGLGMLALAGVAYPLTRRVPFLPMLLAIPGAWFIGRPDLPGRGWVVALVMVVVALGGPLFARFASGGEESPISTWLFAITAAGAWATVPDTEEILVFLGAMVVPTLLAWPLGLIRLGPAGAYALLGTYMWVVAWGGRGREGSIVGATACLGVLVIEPLAIWAQRRSVRVSMVPLAILHLGLVLIASRVAGLQTDPEGAAVIVVPTLLAGLIICLMLGRGGKHGYVIERMDESATSL